MTYYLSIGFPPSFGYYKAAVLLAKSERYLNAVGERVYNPCELFGTECSMAKRWLYGIRYLLKSDVVIFPSTWRNSVYSRIDMCLCKALMKKVIVKQFD